MSGRAVTEGYERRLWEELNLLLADAVPPDATPAEAEDAVVRALTVPLTETSDLYGRIKRLAYTERGYLRERMDEDNPVTAARRRMEGRRPGQPG
ncbi:MAG TPA: hypothetical protein VFK14_00615 [Solirubrobacterales bacterium]|nr:hypothetical protein [Solirubrobacterales bacterium]